MSNQELVAKYQASIIKAYKLYLEARENKVYAQNLLKSVIKLLKLSTEGEVSSKILGREMISLLDNFLKSQGMPMVPELDLFKEEKNPILEIHSTSTDWN